MSTRNGQIDMKDIAIMDAFPVYDYEKVVLSVGCGNACIDFCLASMGYRVFATDTEEYDTWQEINNLTFHDSNILYLPSFPVREAPVVICSQVLEHIKDYKTALSNLLSLASIRLIVTIPWRHSFNSPEHCNYWDDEASAEFKDINEFVELCNPYRTVVSKILTKTQDIGKQYAYLIVIDKRQKLYE